MTQGNTTNITWIEGSVVENEIHMSIVELSHASRTPQEMIMSWVTEGVLSPSGSSPEDGRFGGRFDFEPHALRVSGAGDQDGWFCTGQRPCGPAAFRRGLHRRGGAVVFGAGRLASGAARGRRTTGLGLSVAKPCGGGGPGLAVHFAGPEPGRLV